MQTSPYILLASEAYQQYLYRSLRRKNVRCPSGCRGHSGYHLRNANNVKGSRHACSYAACLQAARALPLLIPKPPRRPQPDDPAHALVRQSGRPLLPRHSRAASVQQGLKPPYRTRTASLVSGEENAQSYCFVLCITRTVGDFSRKILREGRLSRISFGRVVDRGLAAPAKVSLIRLSIGSYTLALGVLDAILVYQR